MSKPVDNRPPVVFLNNNGNPFNDPFQGNLPIKQASELHSRFADDQRKGGVHASMTGLKVDTVMRDGIKAKAYSWESGSSIAKIGDRTVKTYYEVAEAPKAPTKAELIAFFKSREQQIRHGDATYVIDPANSRYLIVPDGENGKPDFDKIISMFISKSSDGSQVGYFSLELAAKAHIIGRDAIEKVVEKNGLMNNFRLVLTYEPGTFNPRFHVTYNAGLNTNLDRGYAVDLSKAQQESLKKLFDGTKSSEDSQPKKKKSSDEDEAHSVNPPINRPGLGLSDGLVTQRGAPIPLDQLGSHPRSGVTVEELPPSPPPDRKDGM